MAKYVNADNIKTVMNGYILDRSKTLQQKFAMLVARDIVDQAPTADVVEREKIDAALEEIENQRKITIECDGESDLGVAIRIIKECLGEVKE